MEGSYYSVELHFGSTPVQASGKLDQCWGSFIEFKKIQNLSNFMQVPSNFSQTSENLIQLWVVSYPAVENHFPTGDRSPKRISEN